MDILPEDSSFFSPRIQENFVLKQLINELTKRVSYEFSKSPEKAPCLHGEIESEAYLEDLTDIAAETEVVTEAGSATPEDSSSSSSWAFSVGDTESRSSFFDIESKSYLGDTEGSSSVDEIEIDEIVVWADEDFTLSNEMRKTNLKNKLELRTRFKCRFCKKQLALKDQKYLGEITKENTIAKLRQRIRQHEDTSHSSIRTICREMLRSRFGHQDHKTVGVIGKVKCPSCSKFMCASSLPFHIKTRHRNQKNYVCVECGHVSCTATEFLTHFKLQNCKSRSYKRTAKDSVVVPASKCGVCEEIIPYRERFINHYKVYHPEVPFPVGETYQTRSLLQTSDSRKTKTLKRLKKRTLHQLSLTNKRSL